VLLLDLVEIAAVLPQTGHKEQVGNVHLRAHDVQANHAFSEDAVKRSLGWGEEVGAYVVRELLVGCWILTVAEESLQ
jgi:hypothetical protein